MTLYETIFIVRQDMAPSQVDALSEKYSGLIRDGGGSVKKTEYCGLRTLAYPIKKNNKGHYVLMNVASNPAAIKEVERQMYLSDDVIRYMSVCVDAHKDGPSALLKSSRNSNIRDISMTVSGRDSGHHNKSHGSDDGSSNDATPAQAE
ncbi:MAG TPA: 30S ribosomal protein S6 [Holosporales bacterium]|nr:30S ribosomal protein S6 [Holosporales bacterium]